MLVDQIKALVEEEEMNLNGGLINGSEFKRVSQPVDHLPNHVPLGSSPQFLRSTSRLVPNSPVITN